jgi:hypothetical protein
VHCRTASDAPTSLEQGCTCTRHERRTLTTRFVVPRTPQPPIDRSEPYGCGRILAPRIFHKPIEFHPHRERVVPDLERVVESIARGTHVGDRHYRRLRGNRRSFETAGLKPVASACHRWQTGRMISRASCAVTTLLLSTVSGCASDSASRGIPGLCANASSVAEAAGLRFVVGSENRCRSGDEQVRDRRPVSQRRSACHRRQLRLPIARL